jgi:hypothetical protein
MSGVGGDRRLLDAEEVPPCGRFRRAILPRIENRPTLWIEVRSTKGRTRALRPTCRPSPPKPRPAPLPPRRLDPGAAEGLHRGARRYRLRHAGAAEDDPGESFFRSGAPCRGTLLPPCETEDFVPFAEGEPRWHLAGAEKPATLVAFEEAQAMKAAAAARDGAAPATSSPSAAGKR